MKIVLEDIAGVKRNGILIPKDVMQDAITSFMKSDKKLGFMFANSEINPLNCDFNHICMSINEMKIEDDGHITADVTPSPNTTGKIFSKLMEKHKSDIKFSVSGLVEKPKNDTDPIKNFTLMSIQVFC